MRYSEQATNQEIIMGTALSPMVSEFETEEEEAIYNAWFKAKVQESVDDTRPLIPHDQVMAEARALLDEKKKKRAAN
jgi:hypothetical protein